MINKGDRVVIIGGAEEEKYKGCVFKVLSEPYTVCGSTVVKMKCDETGKYFGGGYDVEFLRKVKDVADLEEGYNDGIVCISRYKAENKWLLQKLQQAKSEAIKEFADRLKETIYTHENRVDVDGIVLLTRIDNSIDELVKEMTE